MIKYIRYSEENAVKLQSRLGDPKISISLIKMSNNPINAICINIEKKEWRPCFDFEILYNVNYSEINEYLRDFDINKILE